MAICSSSSSSSVSSERRSTDLYVQFIVTKYIYINDILYNIIQVLNYNFRSECPISNYKKNFLFLPKSVYPNIRPQYDGA